MNRLEVKQIIDKIKAFRQFFDANNKLVEEWTKILLPYRYQDVDKRLDEYFRDTTTFGQYPDAYYLTKYLKTEEELSKTQEVMARCPICNEILPYNDLEEHYDRCSSIYYVYTQGRKYLHKTFDKQQMWAMDKATFDKFYIKVCEEIFKVMPNGWQRHILENVILTYYGKEPKFTIEEIEKMKEEE